MKSVGVKTKITRSYESSDFYLHIVKDFKIHHIILQPIFYMFPNAHQTWYGSQLHGIVLYGIGHIYASLNSVIIPSGNGQSPVSARPPPHSVMNNCHLNPWKKASGYFDQQKNKYAFKERCFENVTCNISAILFRILFVSLKRPSLLVKEAKPKMELCF